jgi:hypothetical protein
MQQGCSSVKQLVGQSAGAIGGTAFYFIFFACQLATGIHWFTPQVKSAVERPDYRDLQRPAIFK